MNVLNNSPVFPASTPLLRSHQELCLEMKRLKTSRRMRKLFRHPLRTVTNRLIGPLLPVFQPDFVAYSGWPKEIRNYMGKLPDGFVTSYSLQPDSAHWLYELIRENSFNSIIECGCGVSTVAIALAIGNRPVRFLSLEHDEKWLAITQGALDRLSLSSRAQLVHSPLKVFNWGGLDHLAPAAEGLGVDKYDLLVIDAPPSHVGRCAVVPKMRGYLAKEATVILDDAARSAEQSCVQEWSSSGLVIVQGYVPLGTGLAVLKISYGEQIHGDSKTF